MGPGGFPSLQNWCDPTESGRVGSIPTLSRHDHVAPATTRDAPTVEEYECFIVAPVEAPFYSLMFAERWIHPAGPRK